MASKTITVSVEARVEKRFRRAASARRGKKKGYLGRALTEAMERWAEEAERSDDVARTLKLLDEGLDLGGLRYERRQDLHER